MNWYSLYRQASPPLPASIPPHIYDAGGIRITDEKMTQETADKEKERNPKFLGSGSWGISLDIGAGQVVKYVFDKKEATLAESLIGNSKYPVAKIFEVKKVQTYPPIWAVVMEKVTPYREIDPDLNHWWGGRAENIMKQLIPLRLDWDATSKNVGFNSEGRLVIYDLGLQHAH